MFQRFLILFGLYLVSSSCERIKHLPSIPKEPKSTERIPRDEEVIFEHVDTRSDRTTVELDYQIHDSKGTLYQIKAVDQVVQKVEIFENGAWKAIDISEVRMFFYL